MSNANLTIDLKARTDKDGKVFFVGKIKAPIVIDCREGAVFLVFTSDYNQEQLQIALMNTKDRESKLDAVDSF